DPKQPEPLAYGAWIRSIVAGQIGDAATKKSLVEDAMARFNRAIQLNPKYPDTYVYRALTYMQVLNDPKRAVPDFQRYLRYAPANASMRLTVNGALQQAERAASGSTPTTKQP